MAGVSLGEDVDNPIAINVTPLVDILFCLCVFFMISFQFGAIEGRFDAWLPRSTGQGPGSPVPITEIRVALFWDEAAQHSVCVLGRRRVADDEELGRLLREAHDDCVRLDKPATPAMLDAEARVPWGDLVDVVNLCKKSGIERIEFALPAPPAERR